MTKAFQVELKKARHRHDLLLCLLVPVLMIIWVGGLSPSSPEELANGYSALFYSVPVINTIILPVMMSLLSSRLWDMEVKGNTTKLLYTLQSRRNLFMGKALFGILEILLITTLEMGSVVFLGKIHGYTEVFPVDQFLYMTVCILAGNLMLFFLEFLLILISGNPVLALCVGIVGALVGLFSAFMPQIVSYFVPWGYFVPLGAYEVANWDKITHMVTYGTRPFNWGLLIFTVVLGAVLFYVAWRKVQKQEV